MPSDLIHDVCVVGAGLWGSSAAYHLALNQEKKICLIGPNEPSTKEYPTTSIFGAHYDEGRISRMNVGRLTEAILVDRSTEKYPEIQKRTGIKFFTEGENVNFGATGSPYIFKSKEVSEVMKFQHLQLSCKEVRERYPYLNIQTSNQCVLQLTKAGIINPRKYLLSMKMSARMMGCDIFEEVVDDISERHLSDGSTEIPTTDNGNQIRARKVLLCTGVFITFKNLLPDHLQPDIIMAPEQTLRIELSEDDLELLKDMPSTTSMTKTNPSTDGYTVPPLRYPNGKMYLKIGHDDLDFIIERREDTIAWYRGNGCPKLKRQLTQMMNNLVPGITPRSLKTDTCIKSALTRSKVPYCDMVTPRIGVTIGRNKYGARIAYEMERIGARMILKGHWDHDLPASEFRIHYKNKANL